MIKRLHLENFGRFRKTSFDFAPVTIFSGPNEAGKTTLFDALTEVISSPKSSTTTGRRLTGRYGKDRQLNPEYEENFTEISPEDFLNIFAIRSGDITLEIEKNSEWMNKVKASLFSGGIDPKTVLDELETVLGSRARNTLRAEAERLDGELKSINLKKEKFKAIREKCFTDEKRIAGEESRMIQIAEEIAKLEAEQKKLEENLNQQSLLKEEKNLKNILATITEISRKKKEKEQYSRFDSRVLDNLKKIEKESGEKKSELDKLIALEEKLLKELSSCVEERAQCERNNIREASRRLLADNLRDTLVPREKLVSTKTKRIWKKPFLLAAALFIVAGVLALFLTDFNLVPPAAALGAALICFLLSSTHRTWEDSSCLDDAIKAARKRWQEETGEDPGLRYEDILVTLNLAAERARAAAAKFDHIVDRVAQLEQQNQNNNNEKNDTKKKLDDIQNELRHLLDETGTANILIYAEQLVIKNNIELRYNELNVKIETSVFKYGASSVGELENIIREKNYEIGNKITETELPDQEIRARENILRGIKTRLEELRKKNIENTGNFNKDLGTIRGQLSGLPEKISECEKNAMIIEKRLEEIKKELRAAKIAHELFSSLAENSDDMLDQLSSEIGELFSSLTEEGRTIKRSIEMKTFSSDDIDVSDAQGEKRESKHLSAGTKDAFLLAARLTLARKSMDPGSRSILVLDEPFLALDISRTNRALALLQKFREETFWQIILLTKDKDLANQAKLVFGSESRVHELKTMNKNHCQT